MTSIQRSINVSFKLPKALLAGLFIMGSAMSAAHSELVIQEKDPGSSIVNQFATLKNADAKSPQLHQLIANLNQRLAVNPNDSLAWEVLAQIYYNNGYHDYAVYAASEAIDQGKSTAELKNILLNSSAIIAQKQLQSGYLNNVDAAFKKEYQHALSKIAGDIYGFNYDESLPKPPKVVRRSVPKKTSSTKKTAAPIKKKTVVKPKRTYVKPVIQKPTPTRSNTPVSTDPFDILR
ncbi:tetratricopeptide repeat protein [Psychrobacter sp. SZ93C1]|uniref:tetratricopeptide repeat protein n=1 Tax=Psychrobacter sp. SZ93C1 TaxID=2792058 RepID=UPI0018CE80F8|nr:hypothetical protein [Psychrobacter sp. SZ93C1]MBH0065064.1 hypothetical protein [Psychrobacter sp. SZ93C1]